MVGFASLFVNTVNAIMQSPFWASTAIIIAYDDSDGWYDHAMGPIVNQSATADDNLNGTGLCGSATASPYQSRCGYGGGKTLWILPDASRSQRACASNPDAALKGSTTSLLGPIIMNRYLKYLRLPTACGALMLCSSIASAQLPDGPGKEVTEQLCGNCHDASIIQAHRQVRDEWVATIQKMMAAGAQGTEEQFTAVLDYVSKNFAPAAAKVNVNQASAGDLASGLGLAEKEAAAIVKYRTDKGNFKVIDDLKKVPDLDFKKIETQKDRLVF